MIPGIPVGRHEVELDLARARAEYSGLNGAAAPILMRSKKVLSGIAQVPDQSGNRSSEAYEDLESAPPATAEMSARLNQQILFCMAFTFSLLQAALPFREVL